MRATVDQAARYYILMADDVGTKGDIEALNGIVPTYSIETSPGNFQLGFRLDIALGEPAEVQHLQDVLVTKLGSDKGAKLPRPQNMSWRSAATYIKAVD